MSSQKSQIPAFKLSLDQKFPEVVVYTGRNFEGDSWRTNLSYPDVGDNWREVISSVVVVSGVWEFWSGPNFTKNSCQLCPGYYPDFTGSSNTTDFGRSGIMSFRCLKQS